MYFVSVYNRGKIKEIYTPENTQDMKRNQDRSKIQSGSVVILLPVSLSRNTYSSSYPPY
jgi:hypothetical protein